MSVFKYVKNIDYFIVYILPYIEIYFNEHPSEIITIHSTENICSLLDMMFNKNIITHNMKQNFNMLNNITDIDTFLSKQYDITHTIKLTKPLFSKNNSYLKSKNIVCIYPKFKPTEAYHNITQKMLDELINNTNLRKYEIYIIGDQLDRLNTRTGKDVDNFIDTLDYLKYCKLFITSESQWHYIALLCNCRNVLVYESQHRNVTTRNIIDYRPFNNNVEFTSCLNCDETYNTINKILDK